MVFHDRTPELKKDGLRANFPKCIVLHSTYKHSTFEQVREFHLSKGWAGVGYHYFIDCNGDVNLCRPKEVEGAHALGFNTSSIGVCYALSACDISPVQRVAVIGLIRDLRRRQSLPVLSHTVAQLRYFKSLDNSLILPEPRKILVPEVFSLYSDSLSKKADDLFLLEKDSIARALTGFKNCPGPSFYEVMRG